MRWLIYVCRAGNSYQLLQLVRDIHFAQIILLAFEVQSLRRGAHHRRFLHLSAPVSMAVLPISTVASKKRKQRSQFKAGASKIQLNQSGFFMKPHSLASSSAPPADLTVASQSVEDSASTPTSQIMVFVDVVELQQSDSLAVHAFGYDKGRRFYQVVVSRTGGATRVLAYLLEWGVLLSFITGVHMPHGLPLLSLVASVTFAVCSFAVMSRTILVLLVNRRQFKVTAVFLSIWFGLACSVLQDERIAVVIFVLLLAVVDALSDAKTTLPASGRFSRTFEKLNAGLFFLALAIFQVENIIASRQLYIVFRPDFIPVNGTVDPDASYVVDSAQALVDLQVSFVLEKLVGFFMLVYRAHPEQFQIVAAPVCRGSNGGGGGGGGGGGELKAAVGQGVVQ